MLRLDDMFKLPVIVPPANGNFVVSSIVTFEAPVTRPFESTVTCETCCAEPYVAAVTAVFANVKAPVFEIVASPLIDTAVATFPALPTNICAEFKVGEILLLNVVQSAAVNNPRLAADDDGKLNVCVDPTVESILKSVPAVPSANVWLAADIPFKLEIAEDPVATCCAADPSQYIIAFVVLLNQVRPLSPATKVPVNAACSAAVKLLIPNDLLASIKILPAPVILFPPMINIPLMVSPALFSGAYVNAPVMLDASNEITPAATLMFDPRSEEH